MRQAEEFVTSCGAFSEALGKQPADVVQELKSGKTLAQIIQDSGSTPDAVFDAMTAEVKARLAEAVDAGRITQQQMDQRLAKLREHFDGLINRSFPTPQPKPSGS